MNRPLKAGKPLTRWAGLAIQTRAKAKKKAPKVKTPEALMQGRIEAYCAHKGLETFHIPEWVMNSAFGWNPARTGPQINAMMNASQEIKGFPDLMITHPNYPGRVLFGECKTIIGKMTAYQKVWQKRVGTKLWQSEDAAFVDIENWIKELEGT